MPEVTSCPSCARQLRVPDSLLGKGVKCPSCGTNFTASTSVAPPAYQQPAPQYEGPPSDADYEEPPPNEEESYDDRPTRRRRRRRSRRGGRVPHRGGLIMALGIISLVLIAFCAFLSLPLGLPAWLMGNHDLKQMRDGYMDDEGEGTTQAGRICGIIGTLLGGLSYLAGCLYLLMILVIMAGNPRR